MTFKEPLASADIHDTAAAVGVTSNASKFLDESIAGKESYS